MTSGCSADGTSGQGGSGPRGGRGLGTLAYRPGHGPNSPSGSAHGDQYRGMHPGGANFFFADDSVRFNKKLIGFRIFQLLATKAGGEVLCHDRFSA